MLETNEYIPILKKLYDKSLILQSPPSEFEPVFWFYFKDAIAHLDFTLCIQGYNIQSMRNIMNMEYMKWRIDEEKKGGRDQFPVFINWLKANHRETFDKLPILWREIYDTESPASYRSFRIAMDRRRSSLCPLSSLPSVLTSSLTRNF